MFSLNFPYAYGAPTLTAGFRSQLQDFKVVEDLGFEPQGEGEHLYLYVQKSGQNTPWVARQLADYAQIKSRDVGYCGLKDRHGITEQWFSLYDPQRRTVDWSGFAGSGITLLKHARHTHKLKPGQHRGNFFDITLRNLCSTDGNEIEPSALQSIDVQKELQLRLDQVAGAVPNYFGEQRFGYDGNNLCLAEDYFTKVTANQRARKPRRTGNKDRKLHGLMISAARSFLFNQVLAARVRENHWDKVDGLGTGPLWGRGRPLVTGGDLAFENNVLAPWRTWCEGLEHVGLKQERRPLVLQPQKFTYFCDDHNLQLCFYLQPGQYATSVLREVCTLINQKKPQSCVEAVV